MLGSAAFGTSVPRKVTRELGEIGNDHAPSRGKAASREYVEGPLSDSLSSVKVEDLSHLQQNIPDSLSHLRKKYVYVARIRKYVVSVDRTNKVSLPNSQRGIR